LHIFQYHAKIQSAQKFSSPLAQKKDGGAMENKVNFMTVSEWLELFAYILGTIGSVYLLTIAYTAAYIPAELAALVLIGVLSCVIIRHIFNANVSREYRLFAFENREDAELLTDKIIRKTSWRYLQRLDKKMKKKYNII